MVDIVGARWASSCSAWNGITSSPVNLGRGMVTFSHGTFPVPAPATAELLRGVPVYQPEPGPDENPGELATPTGAAILTEVADEFGPMPLMTLERIGSGAGGSSPAVPTSCGCSPARMDRRALCRPRAA